MALDLKIPINLLSQDPLIKRATLVVNGLLLILLSYYLAELTWKMIPAEKQAAPLPVVAETGRQAVSPTASKTWNIAKWHLFGQPSAQKPVSIPVNQEITETKLNLVLRGIVASDDPNGGGAIIAQPNGSERFYKVGARLPGNAELKEIHPDKVILQRNNRLEALKLPKDSIDIGSGVPGATQRGASRSTGSSRTARVAPARLRQYRQMIVNNPQRIADLVRVQPHREGGRFVGYRLQPGRDRALFSQVGLLPGDVVTAVNGIQIDNPAKGFNVMNQLKESSQINVNILRNGVPQSIVLNF
ncbi:MAG: type II secretion system protein GspC [Gammaproteobacteria bacterium]